MLKMINILKVVVLIAILFSNCWNNTSDKQEIHNIETTVEYLINSVLINQNKLIDIGSIGLLMNRLILQKERTFRIVIRDSIDLEEEMFLYCFTTQEYSQQKLRHINDNCYEVYFKNETNIFVEGFHTDPNSIEELIIKNYGSVSFDKTNNQDYTALTICLGANVYYSKGLTMNAWNKYFNCLFSIIEAYKSIRNKIGLNLYGQAFEKLKFAEKEEIVKRYPLKIILYYDMVYCSKPVLPSDILDSTDSLLDI